MKPGWTAGVTRARLLLSRALGPEQTRAIAALPSLEEALSAIAGSAYGERVQARFDIARAQRATADTLLWQLRVLAGWLPATGARLMRALAAWFELQNIDARLAALEGGGYEPPPFVLGALVTAWPQIEQARSVQQLADGIAGSAWGVPGGRTAAELALGMRVLWARRVHEAAPEAADWVAGAGALLVARELFVAGSRERVVQLRRLPGIGEEALRAGSIPELRSALHPRAAWALAGADEPRELWRAELEWWTRAERDATAMLARWSDETSVVLAAVMRLAADAQRMARALELAAGGGGSALTELLDAA